MTPVFVNNTYYYINLLTDAQAILTIPSVLATYLTTMAMPWRTLPIHPAFPVSSPLAPEFWAPLAAIIIVAAAFMVAEVRDSRRRLHLFCAAWIALTFVPMVMLHSLPHLIQDYYLYLPSVGWCILLGDADVRRFHAALQMPVAVIVGEEDYATPVAMARQIHEAVAGSTLTILPAARHLTPIESPARIASELQALVARAAS